MTKCDAYCLGCLYYSLETRSCDYIIRKEHRRGCPAGFGCTEREGRALTVEQLRKLADERSKSEFRLRSQEERRSAEIRKLQQLKQLSDSQLRKKIANDRYWKKRGAEINKKRRTK